MALTDRWASQQEDNIEPLDKDGEYGVKSHTPTIQALLDERRKIRAARVP